MLQESMQRKNKYTTWKLELIGLIVWTAFFTVSGVTDVSIHAQESNCRPEVGAGPPVPREKDYVVQEIRSGLYWVSDGTYNTMFLVTNSGVVAVDAPPTLGPNYLKAIAEVNPQPVKYLTYSGLLE